MWPFSSKRKKEEKDLIDKYIERFKEMQIRIEWYSDRHSSLLEENKTLKESFTVLQDKLKEKPLTIIVKIQQEQKENVTNTEAGK